MALTTTERQQVWRGLMRLASQKRSGWGGQADDLLAAVADVDDWITSNETSFNNGLGPPFKQDATAVEKTIVLAAVAAARVSIPFARQLLGEVD